MSLGSPHEENSQESANMTFLVFFVGDGYFMGATHLVTVSVIDLLGAASLLTSPHG